MLAQWNEDFALPNYKTSSVSDVPCKLENQLCIFLICLYCDTYLFMRVALYSTIFYTFGGCLGKKPCSCSLRLAQYSLGLVLMRSCTELTVTYYTADQYTAVLTIALYMHVK
jgi:hypothetical protein